MEPERSLSCSQKPAIRPYPKPAKSSSPIDPYLPKVHLNVILPPTPRSSQWSLPFGPPNQNPVNTSPLSHACQISHPPHPPWFNHPNNIRLNNTDWSSSLCSFLHDPSSSLHTNKNIACYLHCALREQHKLRVFRSVYSIELQVTPPIPGGCLRETIILVGKPLGKQALGRQRKRWEYNSERDLKEIFWEDASCDGTG